MDELDINVTIPTVPEGMEQPPLETAADCPDEDVVCPVAKPKCGCGRGCYTEPRGKLFGYNWLEGISDASDFDIVEVQFKNTRKGFFKNSSNLDLHIGDMVAVEASPGHDIGQITMVGRLVALHMRRANIKSEQELKKVFRLAHESDLEKYREAKEKEQDTMIRSRRIAEELNLNMKIGDVEYQGDGAKAIFYYIADERVDFRKLIRVLADTFKIRIEMKQIGARQEAGRIGGIGPCGRPLCCSSWMSNFVSVGTNAARVQDLSMNPQKLAGQCAKLKCCLNFESDIYVESASKFPPREVTLETKDATYFHFKSDILAGKITYSTDKKMPVNCVTIDVDRAKEIIEINKSGEKPDSLTVESFEEKRPADFVDTVGQDNIERFDNAKKKRKRKNSKSDRTGRQPSIRSVNKESEAQSEIKAVDSHQRRENRNRQRSRRDSDRKKNGAPQNARTDNPKSKREKS